MTWQKGAAAIEACLLLAMFALGTPCAAQIYKWVDEKGTVHFSNDPPAKAPAEELPETKHQPLVKNGSPEPEGADADAPHEEVTGGSWHGAESEPEPEDVESSEMIVDESDTIIVEDGLGDPVTRYRANSPRNRPGQPVQQPRRQPSRGR
ncbi:MAG: DUF4124 domain-containing protein [Candidatus Binatia bacterium]